MPDNIDVELLVKSVKMLDHCIAPGKGKEKSTLIRQLLDRLSGRYEIDLEVSSYERKQQKKHGFVQ